MKIAFLEVNRAQILGFILLMIPVGIFALFYFQEWVEYSVPRGMSQKAFQNNKLAMEQYLQKRGIEFQTSDEMMTVFEEAVPTDTVVYLPLYHGVLAPHQTETILDWVQAGGTLLYRPNRPLDNTGGRPNDPILEHLSVQLHRDNSRAQRNLAAMFKTYREGCTTQGTAIVKVDLGHETLQTNLSPFVSYTQEFTGVVPVPQKVVAIQETLGWIILIASDTQWGNQFFLCHDNSKLLYNLITYGPEGLKKNTLIWLQAKEFRWLTDRLWENYPIQVLLLLCIVVLWIRMVTVRQVRHFPPKEDGPRSIREYVSSTAHFKWQAGKSTELLAEQRRYILSKTKSTKLEDAVEELTARTELTRQEIEHALLGNPYGNKKQFISMVKTLNRLRQKL